jgi:hypothetical protein
VELKGKMMIEYYTSDLMEGEVFAAVDNVIVGLWINDHWIERWMYQPMNSHYRKIRWQDTLFDPALVLHKHEFEYVRDYQTVAPSNVKQLDVQARHDAA